MSLSLDYTVVLALEKTVVVFREGSGSFDGGCKLEGDFDSFFLSRKPRGRYALSSQPCKPGVLPTPSVTRFPMTQPCLATYLGGFHKANDMLVPSHKRTKFDLEVHPVLGSGKIDTIVIPLIPPLFLEKHPGVVSKGLLQGHLQGVIPEIG